jgi:integrase
MSKVKLQVRVKVKAGDRNCPFVSPAFSPNGKTKPGVAVIDAKEAAVERTLGYYLRYTENGKRRLKPVGADAVNALNSMRLMEAALNAKAYGIRVAEESKQVAGERVRLADAATEYLAEVQKHKRLKTYNAYSQALKLFQQGCKVDCVDEIGRNCVMNFKTACEAEYGCGHTAKNLFAYVITFLNRCGKRGLVKQTDWPKAEHREYEPWTDEDIRKMVAVCKTDKESVLILLARGSGFRKGEIVHSQKSDINFAEKTIRTRSKPELGFQTKDCEERTVPVDDRLIEALASFVETSSGSLPFARKDGKPDIHIDRIVKRVAKRAGVNVPKKPMHSFRVLYATALCRAGVDIYTIQKLLRHADDHRNLLQRAAGRVPRPCPQALHGGHQPRTPPRIPPGASGLAAFAHDRLGPHGGSAHRRGGGENPGSVPASRDGLSFLPGHHSLGPTLSGPTRRSGCRTCPRNRRSQLQESGFHPAAPSGLATVKPH